jgi:hypothetical protein
LELLQAGLGLVALGLGLGELLQGRFRLQILIVGGLGLLAEAFRLLGGTHLLLQQPLLLV